MGTVQIHLIFYSLPNMKSSSVILSPISGSTLDEFACTGDYESEEDCNTQAGPYWTPWSDWTQCTKSCGGGQRSKVQGFYDVIFSFLHINAQKGVLPVLQGTRALADIVIAKLCYFESCFKGHREKNASRL